jgi:hypothetical protein
MKKFLLMLLVAAVWTISATVQAQVTQEEFDKVKGRVTELEKEVATLRGQLKEVAGGVVEHGTSIRGLNGRMDENEKGLLAVLRRVEDTDRKLEDLARPDPSNPQRRMLDVLGNMQRSAAFRNEIHNVTTGRLVITNNTGADQFLHINGTLWRVVTGRSYAPVPRGTVVVQRPGAAQERLDGWKMDGATGFLLEYNYPQAALSPVVILQ